MTWRVPLDDASAIDVWSMDLGQMILRPATNAEGWLLRIRHRQGHSLLTGTQAMRAAGLLLPGINIAGARPAEVQRAVGEIERAGHPEKYFAEAARALRVYTSYGLFHVPLTEAPHELRLALEMAAHEEVERQALEGELRYLERAWREAEEIAAISDRLTLPESVEEFIRRHRESAGAEAEPHRQRPDDDQDAIPPRTSS